MNQKNLTEEKVFELVKASPGISSPQVAEKLSMSRVSAFRHLKSLLSIQKIRALGNGKATRYFLHENLYVGANSGNEGKVWSSDQVRILKDEILFALTEQYGETVSEEGLNETFEDYCTYIAPDDTVLTGFVAFLAWCGNQKHDFSERIVEKALEYLEIIGSIEYRRKKNGFLDGSESARANLKGLTDIGFDHFFFTMPSVLENGFGRTRTAIELYYGKLNNRPLLERAIRIASDRIRRYVTDSLVDGVVFTPPTNNRTVQFRDLLENELALKIPKIRAEKVPPLGKVLQPQKDIRDREQRVRNAFLSLQVTIPNELPFYKHVLILDDSFTTGATPNAIALKLREAGYEGKITIITICGSFNYDLAITEDEI